MSADVTHLEREDPRPLYDEVSAGHGPAGGSFNPLDSSQRQLDGVLVSQLLSPRVAGLAHFESEHELLHSLRPHLPTEPDHRLERSNQAAARVGGAESAGVRLVETDLVAETRGLPPAERQQGTSPVGRGTEMNEVRLAFRALIEQVRLVWRDGRRLIRRLIAMRNTSGSSSMERTNSPAPLASVPLVVLRSTTEREQIELNDLVQRLSAEGYQVTRRGPQWVVYTEITDRRTSVSGRSPQDSRGTAATSARVRSASLRQCRSDDRPQ